jgi:alkylhydroperoxidase/carboxymuconolactone decarboxylase family protein YurZ
VSTEEETMPDDPRTDDGACAEARARFSPWNGVWERTLRRTPAYVATALDLERTAESGEHLDPKTRAFVQVTLNAALTHRDAVGLRRAINAALDAGATEEELVEVLFVTVTLAVHGMNIDVLTEVLDEEGLRAQPVQWTPRQVAIREEYTTARGYWATFLDPTLELAPDFLEAYLAFSAAPARFGVLDAKTREFIYLAFDTSPTHLHRAGMRVHIRNALRLGATPAELAEVMALSVGLGLGTLEFAMPILDDEVGRRQM